MKMKLLLLCFAWLAGTGLKAQQPPFWTEINAFNKADSLVNPPAHPVVFTGSSSIRLWKGLKDSFPALTLINRGFGGSSLTDMIRYENETVLRYKPKQVVIYCGENDIASSDTVTADMVLKRFKKWFSDIREQYPGLPITFISIKPSPSRWHMRERMVESNRLIKAFLETEKHTDFINVWNPMLDANGNPDASLFVSDNLHMNAKGYAIWGELVEPYVLTKKKKRKQNQKLKQELLTK